MSREPNVEHRGSEFRNPARPPFRFEKLEVWHAARALSRALRKRTRVFPRAEQFELASQLRRAAVSITSNIAEGSGRNSDKDFAHFLEQAYGSAMEVASQLFDAFDDGYLSRTELDSFLSELSEVAGKIGALNRSLGVTTSKVTPRAAR